MRYNRTQASRSVYAACAFAVLVGWPLWLKLMTISKIDFHNRELPWKQAGKIRFVKGGLGNDKNCHTCQGYPLSVNWPIQVQVENVTAQAGGGVYVITYTSSKWKGPWYQSSLPTILNNVHEFNQTMDVCKVPQELSIAPTLSPTHPGNSRPPTVVVSDSPTQAPVAARRRKRRALLGNEAAGEEEMQEAAEDEDAAVVDVEALLNGVELPPYVNPNSAGDLAAFANERLALERHVKDEDIKLRELVLEARAEARQAKHFREVQTAAQPLSFSPAAGLTTTTTMTGRALEAEAVAAQHESPSTSLELEVARRQLVSEKITGEDDRISYTDYELMNCCHGPPGPVYVVACVVTDYFTARQGRLAHKNTVLGPPFDDRCAAVAGVCGGSCGSAVRDPKHCIDGHIPDYLLVSSECEDGSTVSTNDDSTKKDKGCGPRLEDDFEQLNHIPDDEVFELPLLGAKFYFTQTPPVWHWAFMCMMFMSYVSICVASIPGAGVCGSAHDRLPILHTLDQNGAIKDGVKCISFSISASEHKMWVLRNLLGKVASSFLHPSARLFDFFQDEGTRAGAYALWDALVYFLHVPPGVKEDTVGMAKFWAARLRDPADTLNHNVDTFKKDAGNREIRMGEIERELDTFEGMHEVAPKFNVSEERLSMLHYAYELYELVECLGDRSVWTGWDVPVGSKEEAGLELQFDKDEKEAAAAMAAASSAGKGEDGGEDDLEDLSTSSHAGGRGGNKRGSRSSAGGLAGATSSFRNSHDGGRQSVGAGGRGRVASFGRDSVEGVPTTAAGFRAQAIADAALQRELEESSHGGAGGGGGYGFNAEEPPATRHLDGLRDWLHHPVMSSFVLQWAHSLCDVAYAAKKATKSIDPFCDEVLGFARKDEAALKCARALHLFGAETKVGDKANNGKGGGRFLDAYQNFKKTTGQILFDFIDEREITMGTYRGTFSWAPATMMYGTRAKPERRDKDAIKKRNLQPGIYACLNGDIELPSYPDGMSKFEAERRCYGKIREILADRNVDGRRVKFVELSHLSEDMLRNKMYLENLYSENAEMKSLWAPKDEKQQQQKRGGKQDAQAFNNSQQLVSENPDLGGGSQPMLIKLQTNAFIQLPLSILDPLLRCRGKAGGMNFAVKILENREYERAEMDVAHHVPSLTLFAIFDCRHMVTPGFWEQTILHFFRERDGEVHLQPSVKYCQVPQNFIGVELATDYLDMQNEYLFRYVNCMRDGVGAVTSCGTNCVWAIERGFEYEEKTMIEDTATSHKVILEGYEGTYHYEKLIFGTPKENKDFLAAIFRWSRGAVQLFWLAVLGGRSGGSMGVPFLWMVLALVILPMAITVFSMLSATGQGAQSLYLSLGIYVVFVVVATAAWCTVMSRRFGHLLRYLVLFDNSTYFFNTFPAYFWCLVLPGYMCNFGDIPFKYSLVVVACGGLVWEILNWILILEVKGWSIVEGKRPKDISILRSQQMFFVNCPLHGVAFYSGSQSAYRIIFKHHDASSWSSFGHGGPGDWIVKWLLFLVSYLVISILSAVLQIGMNGLEDTAKLTSFSVGIVTALIFLGLVFDPFCILMTGKTLTVTLKHAYFVFWSIMLVLGILVLGFTGLTLSSSGGTSGDDDYSR